MLRVEYAFSVNPDNSITWGEFRVHPDTPIDDAVITGVYGDVNDFILNNPSVFTLENLTNSGAVPGYEPFIAVLSFDEAYSYNGTVITKLPEYVRFQGVNVGSGDSAWCDGDGT